jgi:hypothetical protein
MQQTVVKKKKKERKIQNAPWPSARSSRSASPSGHSPGCTHSAAKSLGTTTRGRKPPCRRSASCAVRTLMIPCRLGASCKYTSFQTLRRLALESGQQTAGLTSAPPMVWFGKALEYLHGAHIVVGNPILRQQRCELLGRLAGFMARPDIGGKTSDQASSIMEATSHAPGEAHVITTSGTWPRSTLTAPM